jgi:predicted lipid-binding transport protein (Tim44 family)
MSADVIPEFDLDEFSAHLRTAFFTTRRAWSLLKPELCRHVMTEALWVDQKSRMEAVKLEGSQNVVSGLIISQVDVTGQRSLGYEDEVSVRLIVAGEDYILHPSTDQVMIGSAEPDQWVEEWVLRRSRDPEARAAAENPRCPNCGAPLTVDSEGQCAFCQAVVPGAKADWLASYINRPAVVDTTAPDEGQGHGGSIPGAPDPGYARAALLGQSPPSPLLADDAASAGLAAIQGHDPAFNIGGILAEARETFLRLEQLRSELDLSGLRPYVADALWEAEVAREEAARADGRQQVHSFLEVHSIVVAGAASDAAGDHLSLRVTAQSADHVLDTQSGRQVAGDNNLSTWTATMFLDRGPGLTSDPLRGLQAHSCPSCGASFNIGQDGRCRGCGQHVTGGEFDWVLSRVETPAASGGPRPSG